MQNSVQKLLMTALVLAAKDRMSVPIDWEFKDTPWVKEVYIDEILAEFGEEDIRILFDNRRHDSKEGVRRQIFFFMNPASRDKVATFLIKKIEQVIAMEKEAAGNA